MNQIEPVLAALKETLSLFFQAKLNKELRLSWEAQFNPQTNTITSTNNLLTGIPQQTTTEKPKDIIVYLNHVIQNPSIFKSLFKDYYFTLNTLFYIRYVRNKWAHQAELSQRQVYKFFDEVSTLLEEISPGSEEFKYVEFQRRMIIKELSDDFRDYVLKHSDEIVNWRFNSLKDELSQSNKALEVQGNEITRMRNYCSGVLEENERLKKEILELRLCVEEEARGLREGKLCTNCNGLRTYESGNLKGNRSGDCNINKMTHYTANNTDREIIDLTNGDNNFIYSNTKDVTRGAYSRSQECGMEEENFNSGVVYNEFIERMEEDIEMGSSTSKIEGSRNQGVLSKEDTETFKEKYKNDFIVEGL
mmetsp:Transcript_23063/g.24009  ORF Transcript_23063/g.24009 Transcript_23063/m.24009 type:complete len:362 (-) Transcript_23063:48-1133(-)